MQNPKNCSHAGKLKSLPWRLSILLHSWTQACRHSVAGENVELPWGRELPRYVVELSRTIFDYLSLQSQLLAPSSDLLAVLDQAGLRESCAQRYPSLLLPLETNTLPREPLPEQVPVSDTFATWWSGLTPDAKLYCLLTAHWILTSTTTAVVDQGTCVKKNHSKDTAALLPRETNKAHCQSAFLLLKYTQVAWLVKKPGAAPRLRKRSYPPLWTCWPFRHDFLSSFLPDEILPRLLLKTKVTPKFGQGFTKVTVRFFKLRGVSGFLGQVRRRLPKGFVEGFTEVPPRLRKFRYLASLMGQVRLGLPKSSAQDSSKVSPRFYQGSTKVLQVSWCLWFSGADPRKVPPTKAAPRFHQGSTKVAQVSWCLWFSGADPFLWKVPPPLL